MVSSVSVKDLTTLSTMKSFVCDSLEDKEVGASRSKMVIIVLCIFCRSIISCILCYESQSTPSGEYVCIRAEKAYSIIILHMLCKIKYHA